MKHLFFNLGRDITAVAGEVFGVLHLSGVAGNSKNVLNGVYYQAALSGVLIRIEGNSYDFEDRFSYMITIKRNMLAEIRVRDDDLLGLARFVQHVLVDNLNIEVALEVENALDMCEPYR